MLAADKKKKKTGGKSRRAETGEERRRRRQTEGRKRGKNKTARSSYLIEVGKTTGNHFRRHILPHELPTFVPEAWVFAGDRFVVQVEVPVPPRRLPHGVVLGEAEGGRLIQVTLKADEVSHGGHRVFQHDVHASLVYLADGISPLVDGAEVAVQQGQVEGAERVGRPGLVDEWTAGNVETLSPLAAETFVGRVELSP